MKEESEKVGLKLRIWKTKVMASSPITSWQIYGETMLRVPWTARRSNQSILKEINPECSLEGLMLKFQYLGHLMQRVDLLQKTLMVGKVEGRRWRGRQRMIWLDGITSSMDMCLSQLQDMVKDREALRAAAHGIDCKESDMTEQLSKPTRAYHLL